MRLSVTRALLLSGLFTASSIVAVVACGGGGSGGGADPSEGGASEAGTSGTGLPIPGEDGSSSGGACGDPSVTPGSGSQSITVSGAKRTYDLFVPSTYDGKRSFPLVFVFHGDGGTGANIRSGFPIEKEAAGAAIFAYPDGLGQTWDINDATGLARDVAFIDAVAADLAKTHCTDTARVFVVGFSRGAYFANMLACMSKTKLRAVVAHSGGGPFGVDGTGTKFDNDGNLICPSAPIAAMQIIGTADDLLGDGQKARDYWKRVNTCGSSSSPFDPSPCVSFDGCAQGRSEVYCEIPGMGHQVWSSATSAIWSFLKTK